MLSYWAYRAEAHYILLFHVLRYFLAKIRNLSILGKWSASKMTNTVHDVLAVWRKITAWLHLL